ncbi:membrane protein [[Pasteurella] aerogenes]|nr:membrane protein [[Pasteurella] aerogenes]
MKLVKCLSAVAVLSALAACSTASDVVSSTSDAVKNVGEAVVDGAKTVGNTVTEGAKSAKEMITGTKTVLYSCDVSGKRNQPVSATYSFKDNQPETATVTIGKKVVGKDLALNRTYTDGVQFVAGDKIWSLDTGFSVETVNTTVPVMFTSNNEILARNCTVAK